jgi:hypothetical protein
MDLCGRTWLDDASENQERKLAREHDKFLLRFPDGARDAIAASAKANRRSMNAEINARLFGAVDTESPRDKIAIAALTGLLSCQNHDGSDFLHDLGPGAAAMWAYRFADAMLAARKGGAS